MQSLCSYYLAGIFKVYRSVSLGQDINVYFLTKCCWIVCPLRRLWLQNHLLQVTVAVAQYFTALSSTSSVFACTIAEKILSYCLVVFDGLQKE